MARPEDILSDEENTKILNGVSIRKGTIAAFLQNISMIEQPEYSEEQKQAALSIIRELAPAVIATGLYILIALQELGFSTSVFEQMRSYFDKKKRKRSKSLRADFSYQNNFSDAK